MGTTAIDDYCSYTKAVEFLGDRWCLLILRDLAMKGPLGFNAFAAGLPGHISRSTLIDRLRRLEDIGVIRRSGANAGRQAPYGLTAAGVSLLPTVMSLYGWSQSWLPEDPAMIERDPSVVMVWIGERVDRTRLPERQVILDLTVRHDPPMRGWLILEAGSEPKGCLEDPLLDESRYVYLETTAPTIMALAKGYRDPAEALADGSVAVFGDPELVAQLPTWFLPADRRPAEGPGPPPGIARPTVGAATA